MENIKSMDQVWVVILPGFQMKKLPAFNYFSHPLWLIIVKYANSECRCILNNDWTEVENPEMFVNIGTLLLTRARQIVKI